MLGVQADWRPSRLPIWESERGIRGSVLRPRAPICVLVRLPGPPGGGGGGGGGGRRGGGGGAKPRGVAHTAVNITSLRPQTSVVPHRSSSVLPVHINPRLYVLSGVTYGVTLARNVDTADTGAASWGDFLTNTDSI
ncbi:hypothetical protein DBV15_04920 [Temnothorax longispinosus]|uniref:Uncharacterized protein n=1 Tax=Temnothorax longispinosus TaxID=300112 RepID=A0A4V3SBP5_9HYME|nr:hypothetical protein DBV15_04920 [Temnothorax longispinosus]